MKFFHLTAAIFVIVLFGIGTIRIHQLEQRSHVLEEQLHDALVEFPQVEVTCVCPEYEEGWDDAEYVSGCDSEEMGLETIQSICIDLETYGYVPHC